MKSSSEDMAKQYAPHLSNCFIFCFENGLELLNGDVIKDAEVLTQYFIQKV